MPNPPLVPTDAEQLLLTLNRSVSRAASTDSAVFFDPEPDEIPAPPPPSESQPAPAIQTPDERLRAAEDALEAAARALGSVPPPTATLRGRIGRLLIRVVNQIIWWPLSVGQQAASALIHVVRVHREEQIKLHQSVSLQIVQFAAVLHERNLQFESLTRNVEDLHRNHAIPRLQQKFETRFESIAQDLDALRQQLANLEQSIRRPPAAPEIDREPYVAILRRAGIGTAGMPVLDLAGSARWLDLLRSQRLSASAIDPDIEPASYLAALPPASFGAITPLHLVQHLPIGNLTALLDHTRRVLKPNGLVICETTAASTSLIRSALESRGFHILHPLELLHDLHAIIGARP